MSGAAFAGGVGAMRHRPRRAPAANKPDDEPSLNESLQRQHHFFSSAAGASLFCFVRALARHVGEELVDQALEHDRRLCELDLTALLQEGFRAARADADVLAAQQSRGLDAGVAVLGDLARTDPRYARTTAALKSLGSNLIDSTRPMRTPAMVTGEPGLRSPMLSNLAVTRVTAVAAAELERGARQAAW